MPFPSAALAILASGREHFHSALMSVSVAIEEPLYGGFPYACHGTVWCSSLAIVVLVLYTYHISSQLRRVFAAQEGSNLDRHSVDAAPNDAPLGVFAIGGDLGARPKDDIAHHAPKIPVARISVGVRKRIQCFSYGGVAVLGQ